MEKNLMTIQSFESHPPPFSPNFSLFRSPPFVDTIQRNLPAVWTPIAIQKESEEAHELSPVPGHSHSLALPAAQAASSEKEQQRISTLEPSLISNLSQITNLHIIQEKIKGHQVEAVYEANEDTEGQVICSYWFPSFSFG